MNRRARAKRLTLPLICAAPLVAVAGCSLSIGGAGELEADQVHEFVKSGYKEQTGLGLKELKCEPVKAEVDAPLNCEGVNDNEVELEIGGDVRSVEGDTANFHWEVTRALAPGTLFAGAVGDLLQERTSARIVEVVCPTQVEIKQGDRFECTVNGEAPGDVSTATIELTDGDGKFRIVSVKPADGAPPA